MFQPKRLSKLFFSLFVVLAVVGMGVTAEVSFNPADSLPLTPDVTINKLDNGLTYYIKHNKKPENRAQIWLAVNAGAILEDDDQKGLAHFVEHMAFNGTKNFEKQELINYLESIGMKFGPEINAYTGFDQTVYMLQIPTDSTEIILTAFQILEDWAHQISFEDEEIDKERGVIVEEWRLGQGAGKRMQDKQLPIIFKGSKYAKRLPIGDMDIVKNAPYKALKRFYRDWYRPDLMAVIAVGDFDSEWIESLIQKHFNNLKMPGEVRPRVAAPVPDHDETLFAIATDPEAVRTQVAVYYKSDVDPEVTVQDYRRMLIRRLYNRMLNFRLAELTQKADPPYIYGYSGKGRFVRSKDVYILGAGVREDGIERGLETLLIEADRVKQHGFTQSEMDRNKEEMLRYMEKAVKEKDKTESDAYAEEFIRHYMDAEPMPGIDNEYALMKQFLPEITLQEVNELAEQWITDNNRVITINAPEKEDLEIPSENKLLSIFDKVNQMNITAYEDDVSDEPLVEVPPKPGKVVSEKTLDTLGVTEWKLSNGIRVVLKPTDFKNDEILFQAYSTGGHSLSSNKDYMSASTCDYLVQQSGVGNFDQIALAKKLSSKVVQVNPYIGNLTEGFSGSASPQDLETLFELVYLYATAPRSDSTAFQSYLTRLKAYIQNRNVSPDAAYSDTIQVTLANHHFRSRPLSIPLLNEIDQQTCFEFYKNRFEDMDDFTFIFVGNFEPESIKPLVETYLACLPKTDREEVWQDPGVYVPKGVIHKAVYRGSEPKSKVRMVFSGDYDWNRENNYALASMVSVLRIKLREVLREDLSGTYGVSIYSSTTLYPHEEYEIHISFGCAPERVDEMEQTVYQQIDSLKTFGPDETYITKVRETQLRSYEVSMKENGYWLDHLQDAYFIGYEPDLILKYPELIKTLNKDMVQEAVQKYFNMDNFIDIVLFPEKSDAGD